MTDLGNIEVAVTGEVYKLSKSVESKVVSIVKARIATLTALAIGYLVGAFHFIGVVLKHLL